MGSLGGAGGGNTVAADIAVGSGGNAARSHHYHYGSRGVGGANAEEEGLPTVLQARGKAQTPLEGRVHVAQAASVSSLAASSSPPATRLPSQVGQGFLAA